MLDTEIKSYYHGITKNKVRKDILPGNTKSLWNAVKIAKDQNAEKLPNKLYKGGEEIEGKNACNEFAKFFDDKVKNIVETAMVDENIYNGVQKVQANNKMFMDEQSVRECILSLKIKNSEGFDRIPQRILIEGYSLSM